KLLHNDYTRHIAIGWICNVHFFVAGIGSEDCPPLNMSIEAEMAIEHMREQHQREVEKLTLELENKTMHYEEKLKEINLSFEREQEALKVKLDNEVHKAEEQIKIFKMKHLELEAVIQRLKEEQKEAEFMHQDQVSRMEEECNFQKQHLMEKEETFHRQLEDARQVYHKEKEELAQRAEDSEKRAEAQLAELMTTYEDKRDQLEQSFQEEMSSFQESHQLETQELRRQLLEQHQQEAEVQRAENITLKEENVELNGQVSALKEEEESSNQKMSELLNACEEMWVNLETIQNEKFTLEKMVTELTSRNEQLVSENEELFLKNSKNQENLQDLNCRLMMFLKQKDRKDSAKGLEEWQREKCQMKEEIESYRAKILNSEQELSQIKVRHRFLEQENTLLRQEIETKELAKCSEITDLKNEISLMKNKNDKLLKEVETLGEELGSCVAKSAKVGYLENKIANLKQEQKTWEQQSNTLRSQLTTSQEKIQNLEESLQNVNLQMSRIKSDLRVAQQEKESLKQEVMSLHKQLQNANAKKQVLEMAIQSSGLQNQQKKQYWDDLEQLMEQEQQLLRQENERLQREVHNTKSDLAQTREKVRQLESTVISLKHQKQGNQSSLVKALEQEKSSLRRECDQLQLELTSANRKISQLSTLEREMETLKMENEGLRKNQGKFDDHLVQMLHSPTSLSHSHSQLQQQACATVPRDQYLQLQQQFQQAERSNQQLRAALDNRSADGNSPQDDQEKLLQKMETRMSDVEQKLRIVKMLLQEKVNQLKEQVTRNSMAETKIKDLYVENSQLIKALELSEQRQQTAEKKNYLLEEKISGLSKIVRDLTPNSPGAGHSHQRRA
ncbi:unnamed protein product, partial [Staurois parvus]